MPLLLETNLNTSQVSCAVPFVGAEVVTSSSALSSGRTFLELFLAAILSLSLSLSLSRPYESPIQSIDVNLAMHDYCADFHLLFEGRSSTWELAPAVRLSSSRLPAHSSLTWHSILVRFNHLSLRYLSYLLDSRLRHFVGF